MFHQLHGIICQAFENVTKCLGSPNTSVKKKVCSEMFNLRSLKEHDIVILELQLEENNFKLLY